MSTNAPYYNFRSQGFGSSQNEYEAEGGVEPSNDGTGGSEAPVSMYPETVLLNPPLEQLSGMSQQLAEDESHNTLVELLAAANNAAGHNQPPNGRAKNLAEGTGRGQSARKRKRDAVLSLHQEEHAESVTQDQSAGDDTSARARVRNAQVDDESRNADSSNAVPADPTSPTLQSHARSEARAAGVHSAAALFRKPMARTTKKYTRPPMSKLFMSLQLSPENFLHLQAAAKSYMLDPAHPERRDCVGNRGKGDIDLVKLRLFNCVKEFLDDGVGEHFFGENVLAPSESEGMSAAAALGEESPGVRQWFWPRDATKIVTLVTPLLRRMVTNERQRVYAVETRKGSVPAKKQTDTLDGSKTEEGYSKDVTAETESIHSLGFGNGSTETTIASRPADGSLIMTSTAENSIQIFICQNNEKLLPRLDLPPPQTQYQSFRLQSLVGVVTDALERAPLHNVNKCNINASNPRPNSAGDAGTEVNTGNHGLEVVAAAAAAEAERQDRDKALSLAPDAEESGAAREGDAAKDRLSVGTDYSDYERHLAQPSFEVRALTPNGLVLIEEEEELEAAKEEVGKHAVFEGILKITVELL